MLLLEHCSMDILYDTFYVSIVIWLTLMRKSFPVKNIPHMYVIHVLKNGSMLVCKCRAIHLQCLTCSWLVTGCCWGNTSLLCCKLPSQYITTLLAAAGTIRNWKYPEHWPVALRSNQPMSCVFYIRIALLFLLLLQVLLLGTPHLNLKKMGYPAKGVCSTSLHTKPLPDYGHQGIKLGCYPSW